MKSQSTGLKTILQNPDYTKNHGNYGLQVEKSEITNTGGVGPEEKYGE